ncbi:hypothetical protein H4696_000061 [Amycolatopsis lexingtonensis]|uniref:Uncharacterized protein n=1 Tax=Amycolatopsis lexingtonensis TaxID=218822 RepID=A0ABR9HPV4_9PSEU|nr:hypothetical protein [Amycolatopsis lexingtonensis]MBE1492961.1 hypothetical protein [Amycolatopsis lexingtonensis]
MTDVAAGSGVLVPDAPNVAFGAFNAPNATLGRIASLLRPDFAGAPAPDDMNGSFMSSGEVNDPFMTCGQPDRPG